MKNQKNDTGCIGVLVLIGFVIYIVEKVISFIKDHFTILVSILIVTVVVYIIAFIAEKRRNNIKNEAVKNPKSSTHKNDYYAKIEQQKKNNLQISYRDIEQCNMKPFDLNKPFISDGHFTAIELEGENLEKAYHYLHEVHNILEPFKNLYEDTVFPYKIDTGYVYNNQENHLPISHLRLTPYTATMEENKYPFYLWISCFGDYGAEYLYMIYFNRSGEIEKCDLSLHGYNGARLSYETKIRRDENGLYVMRINKTLYVEPYGTRTIYPIKDNTDGIKNKPKRNYGEHDIDRYARECNAYVVREERKEGK